MSINTDHQLREQMSHDNAVFPITYFHDELSLLPNYENPLNYHSPFGNNTVIVVPLFSSL